MLHCSNSHQERHKKAAGSHVRTGTGERRLQWSEACSTKARWTCRARLSASSPLCGSALGRLQPLKQVSPSMRVTSRNRKSMRRFDSSEQSPDLSIHRNSTDSFYAMHTSSLVLPTQHHSINFRSGITTALRARMRLASCANTTKSF